MKADLTKDGSILVVEDDTAIAALLSARLTHEGYAVLEAKSGAEALARLRDHDFDVMICDMRLPDVTGLALIEQIQSAALEVEPIVVTAFGTVDDAVESLRGGALDYIQKPIDTRRLLSSVRRAIERRKMRRQLSLYRASQLIFSVRDPETLPNNIIDITQQIMEADDASLMLTADPETLELAHSSRFTREECARIRVSLGEGVAGKVALERQPALINVPSTYADRLSGSSQPVRSSIVYPLVVGERLIGVLNVNRIDDPRPFTNADVTRAGILAAQVALALDNARLVRELRQAISELMSTQMRQLESERLAAIGSLAASVTHEIKNPIFYLLANLEFFIESCAEPPLATDPHLSEDLKQALGDSLEGARRIRDIVQDMQDLARAPSDKGAEFDLSDAARSAIRLAGAEVRDRATLVSHFGEHLAVYGNSGQLCQVFLNILVNAAQAIAAMGNRGDEPGRITLTTYRDGDDAVAEISDDGPGIPAEHLGRLFEPFFTTKPPGVGTGLGLPISRDLVRRHGGDLDVRSEVGKGTTFVLRLPSALPRPNETQNTRTVPAPGRLRILYVDDDTMILSSLRRFFGATHEVWLASDGREALAVLERQPSFDAIVCDLLMPQLSGVELYETIERRWPPLARSCVFISGAVGALDRQLESFLERVRPTLLRKPIDLATLSRFFATIKTGETTPRQNPPYSR